MLSALDSSGQTPAEFAEHEGIKIQRLERWQRRLASDQPVEPPAFVELRPRASRESESAGTSMFEVVVGAGRVVRVPPDFDSSALRRLLAVVEETKC